MSTIIDANAVLLLGVEAVIGGVIGLYFRRYERKQEQLEKARIEREQERYAREQERLARMCLTEEALVAILRDRIIQSCRFFIKQGSVPAFERESIERMYNAYHGLGGNDIASDIYHQMCKLPLGV